MAGIRISGAAPELLLYGLPYTAYSLVDFAYVAQALVELTDKMSSDFDEPNNAITSPDGQWIAWQDNFPGVNGEGMIRCISAAAVEGVPAHFDVSDVDPAGGWALHPAWHPDSDRLLYVRGRDGFQGDIVEIQRTNPGVETVIYTNPDPSGSTGHGAYRPQYNRDGTKIAWIRSKNAGPADGGDGLYVCDADGSNLTQIDDFGGSGLHGYLFDGDQFCWDPAADVIYFIRYEGSGATQQAIYMINADGTGLTKLSTDTETAAHECRINARSLSPDGTFLIGTCKTGVDFANSWDFYRWELDGSGGTLLGTLAADGRSLGNTQNFRNCYVHTDGRVYYVYSIGGGQIASFLPDGSDWTLGVDLGVNMDGDQFYTGTGIQWI